MVDNWEKTFLLQLPLKCQELLSPAKLSLESEVRYGSEWLTFDFRLPCFEFLCSDNEVLCCCLASVLAEGNAGEGNRKGILVALRIYQRMEKAKNQEGIQKLEMFVQCQIHRLNDRSVEKEIVEEEQGDKNQTTENLELCSEVVLLILVILSLSLCEAVSPLVHC